ncbi:MAG: glycosyltransferase [Sphingomonas sp.]|nr:glycosyltransferase [Sphingomonas sp.]
MGLGEQEQPVIAVVLGRVSTEDSDRVIETIEALDPAVSGEPCEIVIADRLQDDLTARIRRDYPYVRLIDCPAGMTLTEMRTLAYEASKAPIVAVTEDHCVPTSGWAATIRQAFDRGGPDLVAVGGSVVNGVTDTGLDWATYLCEYSFFSPPVAQGESAILPGMNVAYRRSALERVPRELLTSGFWETTVHPLLLENGGRFLSLNELVMLHKKRFSWGLFASQRFIYSRYFAGLRFGNAGFAKRALASVASLALPPLLLMRAVKAARAKGLGGEMLRASPYLLALYCVWAVGESVGALRGPGNALAMIE